MVPSRSETLGAVKGCDRSGCREALQGLLREICNTANAPVALIRKREGPIGTAWRVLLVENTSHRPAPDTLEANWTIIPLASAGGGYDIEVLLGQSQGPRFGSFVAIYGVAETISLIERALRGEDLAA